VDHESFNSCVKFKVTSFNNDLYREVQERNRTNRVKCRKLLSKFNVCVSDTQVYG